MFFDYPSTKKEAEQQGALHYFTGDRCSYGHLARRKTRDSYCVACKKQKEKNRAHDRLLNYICRARCSCPIQKSNKSGYCPKHRQLCEKRKKYAKKLSQSEKAKTRRKTAWANKTHEEHEKIKEINRKATKKWRELNKEKKKNINKNWKQLNLEAYDAYQKKWRAENKDKVKIYHSVCKQRRRNVPGNICSKHIQKLLKQQKAKCLNCAKHIAKTFTVDHIMPVALGGTNENHNLQLLCKSCNSSKNAKDPIIWAQENGRLL